jgi:hypothetical protein
MISNSRIERLVDRTAALGAGEHRLDEIDELLTDCVAELLTLRAEIRRLEASSGRLEEAIAALRALRDGVGASAPSA